MFSFRIRRKLYIFTSVTDYFFPSTYFFCFSTYSDVWQKLSTNQNKQISVHSPGGRFGRSRIPHSTGAGEAWNKE